MASSESEDSMKPTIKNLDKRFRQSQQEVETRLQQIEQNTNTRLDKLKLLLEKISLSIPKQTDNYDLGEPKDNICSEDDPTKTHQKVKVQDKTKPIAIPVQLDFPKGNQLTPYGPEVLFSNNKRRPDGTLNLSRLPNIKLVHLSESITYVKNIWPEARLPSELVDIGETSDRNRVSLREWHINYADENVFTKLQNIQNSLYTGLVPYARWSQKLAPELSGDFEDVGEYIRNHNPPWIGT